jgi:hypothetical protein
MMCKADAAHEPAGVLFYKDRASKRDARNPQGNACRAKKPPNRQSAASGTSLYGWRLQSRTARGDNPARASDVSGTVS